jgi:hypothetical protein
MAWEWIKRWLKRDGGGERTAGAQLPKIRLLDPADNPWGVPVLDVRPITLGMLSTSRDQQCALNAMSFLQDDGTNFIGAEPSAARTVRAGLQFRLDGMLADGALFIPHEMEHRWALYFHRGQIICIRSWLRQVVAVAEVQTDGDSAEVIPILPWLHFFRWCGRFCQQITP